MRHGIKGCVTAIVIAMLIAIVLIFAGGMVKRITADWRGGTEADERTKASGAFRLASYEEFFQICSAVQNAEAQIASLHQELETEPPKHRVIQINASLAAIRANRASSINSYNAKARQEHRKAFLDSGLPERIDPNSEETTCEK